MIEKEFNQDKLYSSVVHFYVDKKGYSLEKANQIAQKVVKRETAKRTCKNPNCGHMLEDHIRNVDTCLARDCNCRKFYKA